MQYLLLALTGICAGALSGLLGLGGGVIIVPMLVYLMAFDQKTAQAHSLAILVLPLTIPALIQYWNNPAVRPNMHLWAILIIALFFALGGTFGGKLANAMDVNLLRKCFAVFLVVNAAILFMKKDTKTVPPPPATVPATTQSS